MFSYKVRDASTPIECAALVNHTSPDDQHQSCSIEMPGVASAERL